MFSVNVQAVADPDLRILDVVARWPGSVHDSTIFRNSNICARFEDNEFQNGLLLSDAGYPTKTYLLTPLLETNTHTQNFFNESHIRTRNPVAMEFGIGVSLF